MDKAGAGSTRRMVAGAPRINRVNILRKHVSSQPVGRLERIRDVAYDSALADRVRQALADRSKAEERAMFGGLAFMVRGHMCCGLVGDKLMVRVDPDSYGQLLKEPGAQPMDFTGRPMRGFLFVTGPGISTPARLNAWVSRALEFVARRPAKALRPAGSESKKRHGKGRQPASRAAKRANGRGARG